MNRQILLIDFDARALVRWHDLLVERGFTVARATTAAEVGRQLDHSERPDLVILEPMLPGLDGFTLCRSLKNSAKGRPPAVIIASRIFRGQKYRGLARDAGADLFLEKPIDDETFLSTIARYVSPEPAAPTPAAAPEKSAPAPPPASRAKPSAPRPAPPTAAPRAATAAATLGLGWQQDSGDAFGGVTDDEIDDALDRLAIPGLGGAPAADESVAAAPAAGAPASEAAPDDKQKISVEDVASALDRLELTSDLDGAVDPKRGAKADEGDDAGLDESGGASFDDDGPGADEAEAPASAGVSLPEESGQGPQDSVHAGPPGDGDGPFFDRLEAGPSGEADLVSSADASFAGRTSAATAVLIDEDESSRRETEIKVSVEAPARETEDPAALDLDNLDESLDSVFSDLDSGPAADSRAADDDAGAVTPDDILLEEESSIGLGGGDASAREPDDERALDTGDDLTEDDGQEDTGARVLDNPFAYGPDTDGVGETGEHGAVDELEIDRSREETSAEEEDDGGESAAAPDEAAPDEQPPMHDGLAGMDPGTAELLSSLEGLDEALSPLAVTQDTASSASESAAGPPTAEEEESLASILDRFEPASTPGDNESIDTGPGESIASESVALDAGTEHDPGIERAPDADLSAADRDGDEAVPDGPPPHVDEDAALGAEELPPVAHEAPAPAKKELAADAYYAELLEGGTRSRAWLWIVAIAVVVVLGVTLGILLSGGSGEDGAAAPQESVEPAGDPAAEPEGDTGASREVTALRPVPETVEDPAPATVDLSAGGGAEPGAARASAPPVPRPSPSAAALRGEATGAAAEPAPAREAANPPGAESSTASRPRGAALSAPSATPAETADAPLVKLAELDRPLQIVEYERPARTDEAVSAGATGRVFLQVLVGPEGRVLDARVMMEPGHGLGRAASDSVVTWRYTRPSKGGSPVRVWKTEVVEFGEADG